MSEKPNITERIEELVEKFDLKYTDDYLKYINNSFIENKLRFEFDESGFGVRMSKNHITEQLFEFEPSDLSNLTSYLIISAYTRFISKKLYRESQLKEQSKDKINKIIDSLIETEFYEIIIAELTNKKGILSDIKYEISTREIIGKDELIKNRHITLFLRVMEDRYETSMLSLYLSKYGVEKLFNIIKEIKEEMED